MKRLFLVAMMCIALVSLLVGPSAMAAGKSIQGNVNLVEKNSSDWSIIPGGAWGKYNYALDVTTISGVFNGHGLVAGTDYTLIEYNESLVWPATTIIVLGTGTVNASGDIHIGKVPVNIGAPSERGGDYVDQPAGYKIWLVHSADISETGLAWAPSGWLFETSLVR